MVRKEFKEYSTLVELKEKIEEAIKEYGDMPYILTAAYGSTGDIMEIKLSHSKEIIHLITNIMTG